MVRAVLLVVAVCCSVLAVSYANSRFLKQRMIGGRWKGQSLVPPPPSFRDNLAVEFGQFEQKLDHFNTSNAATWQQNYQVNSETYQAGGPMFVMIGGEGPISAGWLTSGNMYRIGREHNARFFQVEHRFYGDNRPTPDVSVKNLKYLSSDQGLADLDAFIKGMKVKYNMEDAKVVVFGGSYPGNLVVWFRELYPDTTVGGVASSAPILAEEDFVEYLQTVGYAQKFFNPACYDAVNEAFRQIQALVNARNDSELNKLFKICQPGLNYDDPKDIQTFYSGLFDSWMGATQYNSVGKFSTVATYCEEMTDESLGDPIHRYSKWYQNIGFECLDHNYQGVIDEMKKDSWDSLYASTGTRQWMWQTCSQFAYYQSSDGDQQPFGKGTLTVDYLEEVYCKGPFGISPSEIAASVSKTNRHYGGRQPNVTNVFLLNGSIDPWHTLSVYKTDLNPTSPSRYVEGTSHCWDMYDNKPSDPQAMIDARNEVAATVARWLQA